MKKSCCIMKKTIISFAWIPYLIFFGALVCSLYYEQTTSQSFFAIHFPDVHCPPYLQASTLFEVVKILGLSNVLVASVYASLNKTVLGLSYSEILNKKYASYHFCSAFHVISTVLCIICAAAGLSESTLICIVAVIYGFTYQWIVLYNLILKADRAKKKASKIWEENTKNPEYLKSSLFRLASTLPSREDRHYFSHLESIALLLVAYIENRKKAKKVVGFISEILSTMSSHQPKENQFVLARDFFETLCTLERPREMRDERIETVSIIANAYVLHKVVSLKLIVDRKLDETFPCVASEISQLAYTLPANITLNTACRPGSITLARKAAYSMLTLFPIITHICYFNNDLESTDFLQDMYSKEGTKQYVSEVMNYLFPKLSDTQQAGLNQTIDIVIQGLESKQKGDKPHD